MNRHRLVSPHLLTIHQAAPPFSFFDFVDKHYPGCGPAVHRLFSLARSQDVETFIVESIPAVGSIDDENREILGYAPDHTMNELHRLSFWSTEIVSEEQLAKHSSDDCIGYCILKHDSAESRGYDRWHVYEAVFRKYPHPHNCVPNPYNARVHIGAKEIRIAGVLYAQQNAFNKACAHVALRSLLCRVIDKPDLSYRQINDLAREARGNRSYDPREGLDVQQIRAVLTGFGINFRDIDYSQSGGRKANIPYQKLVYSGVESGRGALLGFSLSGKGIQRPECHIIPFYGHTFNKDTWAPDADVAYFHVGERLGYVPSESWTSSFLGHDDNFGPNFCIPRLYLRNEDVQYAVEILRPKAQYSGIQAEALALSFLYSLLNQIAMHENDWLRRLVYYARPDVQRVVLRAVTVDREAYIQHISQNTDWYHNAEKSEIINILHNNLPDLLWMVEVSIPQLFPANERKLGEILLDATKPIESTVESAAEYYVLARLPGSYLFEESTGTNHTGFLRVPSQLQSHFPVMGCA